MSSISRVQDWLNSVVPPQPDVEGMGHPSASWVYIGSDSEEDPTSDRWEKVRPPPIVAQKLDLFRLVASRPGTPKS